MVEYLHARNWIWILAVWYNWMWRPTYGNYGSFSKILKSKNVFISMTLFCNIGFFYQITNLFRIHCCMELWTEHCVFIIISMSAFQPEKLKFKMKNYFYRWFKRIVKWKKKQNEWKKGEKIQSIKNLTGSTDCFK